MVEKYELEDFSSLIFEVPDWLKNDGNLKNLFLVSRVRLVRNLEGYPFPHKATKKQFFEILYKINGVILSSKLKDEFKFIDLKNLSLGDIAVLSERGYISSDGYKSEDIAGGIWISEDQNKVIAINNSDHIRISCFDPNRDLEKIRDCAQEIDNVLKESLNYMVSDEIGLLTSSPINVGTGCKFSMLTCLPSISYYEEGYRKIGKLLDRRKMSFQSVNSDSNNLFESEFFVIANKASVNISSDEMIENVNFCIDRIQGYLQHTIEFFFSKDIHFIEDKIYEAASRFKYCRNIGYDEFIDKFSYIILAMKYNYLNFSNIKGLKPLLVFLKDNNLEYTLNIGSSKDIDVVRAEKLREIFRDII